MHLYLGLTALYIAALASNVESYSSPQIRLRTTRSQTLFSSKRGGDIESDAQSRRVFCQLVGGCAAISPAVLYVDAARAEEPFRAAVRPTAYRVDSTQPPTLLPIATAKDQSKILSDIGLGKGTLKEAIVFDRVNLNNILNKAIFGTIDSVNSLIRREDDSDDNSSSASFLCLGLPSNSRALDIELANSVIQSTVRVRTEGKTAVGLHFLPLKSQADLDSFMKTGDEQALRLALSQRGTPDELLDLYWPSIVMSRRNGLQLLALRPDEDDIKRVRRDGISNQDTNDIVDVEGFFATLQNPKYRLYIERSLIKDFDSKEGEGGAGNFVFERAFIHETAAMVAANFATKNPDSLVILLAPTPDLRYLQGINGRIPRLCSFSSQQQRKVTDDFVTTMLLNPSAEETLSKTNFIRLEIGTAPQNLDIQTKIADFLWFSTSPKVNSIPRLMNG